MDTNALAKHHYAYSTLNTFGKIAYLDSSVLTMDNISDCFLYKNIIEHIDVYTQFPNIDLSKYSTIVIPMHIDEVFLSRFSHRLYSHLNRGGIVISFANNFSHFLPYTSAYITSETPIRDREVKFVDSHAGKIIFEGVREYDINHRRGVKGFFNRGFFDMQNFPKTHNLEIFLSDSDKQCVGYIDRDSSNGVILATAGADLLTFGLFDNTTARKMGVNLLSWLEKELLAQKEASNKANKANKQATQHTQIAQDTQATQTANNKKLESKVVSDFGFYAQDDLRNASHNATHNTSCTKAETIGNAKNLHQTPNKRFKNAIITGGASYHHYFFLNKNKKYAHFFDARIYFHDLDSVDLSAFDYIVLASRINASHLMRYKEKFQDFLDSGGHIISFGEITQPYLPNIEWKDYPVNFWWWLIPGADMPLYVGKDGAKLFSKINVDDAKWHCHGAFYPPKNAQIILINELNESIIYKDTSFKGNLYITSLDPEFHLGQGFMPKTEGFFDNFMEWIHQDMVAN